MPDDVKSKIAELEKELYSKDFKQHRVEDILSHKDAPVAAPSWDVRGDTTASFDEDARSEKRHRMMKKFVQFSVGFFVLALVVAGFIWWRGSNIVSGEHIDINIDKPITASGGEPFETKFAITNNNKVSIEAASLFIEYPVGFYSVPDNRELPRISRDLGVIAPGQSVLETVNTLLFGEENTNKEVSVTLEYRMAGSNATLKKTTTYSIQVSSSPVNVKLLMPKEIYSGQEVELAVDVSSNSKNPIDTLLVDASYPSGFTFQSSDPVPTNGTNVWQISKLLPSEKRTIKIRGVVEGQEGDEKITKISVGTESLKDERLIGIVYNASTEASTITKPFLELNLAINNNKSQDNITPLNRGVRVDVLWQSNSPTKITDATIEVKLKGDILDRYSLYASGGGYYRSVDNTIVWDKTGNQELAVIDPGAKGLLSFSFSPIPLSVGSSRLIKNPQIFFEARARAGYGGGLNTGEGVSTFITRGLKFETEIRLGAKGLFFSGPFHNTGAMPPKADTETTYTITLTARNSVNSVSNALIKTTLPIYVKWLGKISPEGEDITFNESTSEVIWNAGRISSGGTREASFQISLLPSVSHINRSPMLTGDFNIVATDDFTKTEVSDKKQAVTTYISSDPQFSPNDANVVQ